MVSVAGFQYTSCVANSVLNELFAEKRIISADQLSSVVLKIDEMYRDLTGKDLLFEKPINARICEGESAKPRLVSIIDFFGGSYNEAKVFMRAPNKNSMMMKYRNGNDPNFSQAMYLALIDIRWGV